MIARLLDYLIHGQGDASFVDLDNPHTQDKIALGQHRVNTDLWSCVWPRYSRDRIVEQRERKVAAMRPSVVAWRKRA